MKYNGHVLNFVLHLKGVFTMKHFDFHLVIRPNLLTNSTQYDNETTF